MEVAKFINDFKQGFGNYELPIAFWYSDTPLYSCEKTNGCYIKDLELARTGKGMSLSRDTVSCPGGKVYAGFCSPPDFIGDFVANKEKYKATPSIMDEFLEELDMPLTTKQYLNFQSVKELDSFDNIEGLIFFATPDVLSGLVSWTLYDTNASDVVTIPFGSGCSSVISQVLVENRKNGNRSFLGMFDPSARPQVAENILTFGVPISRFITTYHTLSKSCLQGTKDWLKVKERIEHGNSIRK